jgi:hypothetical protein
MRDDLVIRHRRGLLAERAHHEQDDVIAPGDAAVEVDAVQHRRPGQLDIPLLQDFAGECLEHGLAQFHPSAGQMPAGHIAVLDQEHAPVPVDDQRAHAERQAAREPPVDMEDAAQRRLHCPADLVEHRHPPACQNRHLV